MEAQDRRQFLQAATLAALAPSSRILGANDKVNVAVIGVGGRGTAHLGYYATLDQAHIAAVCDPNQAAQERAVARVEKARGHKPKVYSDMREVFADKTIDAVSIATPNHWHALATIWACQAGKDVYCEKPASHNIFEARQMVAAARKYKRMVQIGSQSRSISHKQKAIQLLKDGAIGEVYLAKALCFKRRNSIGHKADEPTPPGLNWDLFLGPAPMRPYNELRFRYNWHWFWDTGNGDIGNQGVHEMDVAQWGLGVEGMPNWTVSTGGKMVYDDDQETPNTQLATLDYGKKQIVFEVRGLVTGPEGGLELRGGNCVGNIFLGSDGHLAVDASGFKLFKGQKGELAMDVKAEKGETAVHMQNFLDAVKSRDHTKLTAEIAIGANSAALCHLANISYRLGRRLNWDKKADRFVNDKEADQMIGRKYRSPYIVPEKV